MTFKLSMKLYVGRWSLNFDLSSSSVLSLSFRPVIFFLAFDSVFIVLTAYLYGLTLLRIDFGLPNPFFCHKPEGDLPFDIASD